MAAIPVPVFLQRYLRHSNFDPRVDETELIEANPRYAHIKSLDGREDTVSPKHLATQWNAKPECWYELETQGVMKEVTQNQQDLSQFPTIGEKESTQNQIYLRRSERVCRVPVRLGYRDIFEKGG